MLDESAQHGMFLGALSWRVLLTMGRGADVIPWREAFDPRCRVSDRQRLFSTSLVLSRISTSGRQIRLPGSPWMKLWLAKKYQHDVRIKLPT